MIPPCGEHKKSWSIKAIDFQNDFFIEQTMFKRKIIQVVSISYK